MQYTFRKAIDSLPPQERKKAKNDIKDILGIRSDRHFERIKTGETPIRAFEISEIETALKKYGIVKIWD